MTSAAVQPATGVRVLRTAAGRRALQLGLLMAGLFALGILCGERAHAAEGTPTGTSPTSAASVTSAASASSVASVSSAVTDVTNVADAVRATPRKAPTKSVVGAVADSVTAPVTAPVEHTGRRAVAAVPAVDQDAVASVTRRATRPVGDLVGAVTQQLDTVRGKLPALPATPSLPGLPGLPGMSELPGRLLPAPVTSAPGTTQHGAARPAAVSGEDLGGTTARTPKPVRNGAYGPDLTAATPAPRSAAHADGHRAAAPVTAPSSPAPTGDQGGALGKSAVDNGSPRHGDAHAVTLNDRAPLRLAPGAAARVDAAGTRDRHRDIPIFPG
ncbi:hypothetical protein AB0I54_01160 [Streptomyces sp. NPDC050625]|uniref:hypothetical protein n=1 Tax=Streptomyces sp. NPDC050625 TaxID=3154629 RepID=UPI0034344FA6